MTRNNNGTSVWIPTVSIHKIKREPIWKARCSAVTLFRIRRFGMADEFFRYFPPPRMIHMRKPWEPCVPGVIKPMRKNSIVFPIVDLIQGLGERNASDSIVCLREAIMCSTSRWEFGQRRFLALDHVILKSTSSGSRCRVDVDKLLQKRRSVSSGDQNNRTHK